MNGMLLLGHRGSPKAFTENTLAGFTHALESGLDGIETDIQHTRDGSFVVHHDDHLPNGKRISALMLSEIQTEFPEMMSLEALLEWSAFQDGMTLNLELKNEHNINDGRERHMVSILRKVLPKDSPLRQKLVISSFNPLSLWRIVQLDRSYALGLLYDDTSIPKSVLWTSLRLLPLYSIHPHHDLLSYGTLRWAHDKNLKVFTWTVNDATKVTRYARWGVDGVIGDDPVVLHAGRV